MALCRNSASAKEKPQLLNYEEVFSRIDDDINPIERLNLKTDIDNLVENIYSKIAKNICKFDEKDLDGITTHLINEVPNTNKREVLTTSLSTNPQGLE